MISTEGVGTEFILRCRSAKKKGEHSTQYIPQKNVKSAAVVFPDRLWFYLHFLSFLLYGTPRQFTFFFGTHCMLSANSGLRARRFAALHSGSAGLISLA